MSSGTSDRPGLWTGVVPVFSAREERVLYTATGRVRSSQPPGHELAIRVRPRLRVPHKERLAGLCNWQRTLRRMACKVRICMPRLGVQATGATVRLANYRSTSGPRFAYCAIK